MVLNSYCKAALGFGLGVLLTLSLAHAQTDGVPPLGPAGGATDELLVPGLTVMPGRPSARPLPSVDLTGELIFQILASEVAAQRGGLTAATGTSLELARFTRDPRLARRAVEFALANNDVVRALDAAQLWSELDPSDVEARRTSLSLAAAAGRIDGLGATLRSRIETATDKPAAILETRRILARLQDKKRALSILDEALADVRKLPEAHSVLARAAAQAGDMQRAVDEMSTAQADQPQSEAIAMQLLQYGIEVEPDQAIARARAFVAANPQSRDLRLLLVRALVTRKDSAGALSELQAMARANPEDFEVIYMQGAVNYDAGKLDEADKLLAQYLSIQEQRRAGGDAVPPLPDAGNAQFLRVQIAEDQKRLDDAYELLGKIEDPSVAFTARLRQAVIRGKQGRLDESRKLIELVDPRNEAEATQAALTESQILRSADKLDDAVKVLEAAAQEYPQNPSLLYDLGMLYEQQNRVEEMEKSLRKVIAVKPDHAHAYNALGYSLADRNLRLPEAKTLIERALALAPDDPFIIDSMGWVLYRMGDNASAVTHLERAYSLRPDVEIGVHLGEVLWASGQQERARDLWRQARQKDPANAVLKGTLARLAVTL